MPAARRVDPNSSVLAKVEDYRQQFDKARADAALQISARTVAETAGHRVIIVDMGAAITFPPPAVVLDVTGYALSVAKGGSDRIAVSVDAGDAGLYGPVYPGVTIKTRHRFTRLRLKKWQSNKVPPVAGTLTDAGAYVRGRYLTLVVAKTPDAEWLDSSNDVAGYMWERTSSAQAYNSLVNTPSAATDGISINGARSVRVGVQAQGGSTTSTGTIVWWYDGGAQGSLWGETEVQQPLVLNRNIAWASELETPFRNGRLFPELRSYTDAAGSLLSPTLFLQAFGEGGELKLGDMQP